MDLEETKWKVIKKILNSQERKRKYDLRTYRNFKSNASGSNIQKSVCELNDSNAALMLASTKLT
ncbi:hypothetical protein DWW10_16410 [Bacteroides intestinalis]|uniref:Uncharacterized protein n=1 Tax=Bacteroides intestinalis TaxID=329854 RepID=A0A412Y164_9BACE|nr:hypothetical protein [Bacteroides intestinalis]RGV51244.1 hypothetical protein DWW10_16410 [Bacteroides intestinalis]RHA62682.1 hypothetical protein DW932_03130 [Bacteroides intestinalis]